MPLIDLKTNLKSLKYGSDRIGGGNSGQPYIQTDIGDGIIGNVDDGLIRGGGAGAIKSAAIDTLRIGKFLADNPRGYLFIKKQVGLQLSNPLLENKAANTGIGFLNRIVDFAKNEIGLQPTRIYNSGVNTLAQVPANAIGLHLNRHGLGPTQDDSTKYLAVVQNNDAKGTNGKNNRLVKYAAKLLQPPPISKPLGILNQILSLIPGASLFIKPQQQVIDSYIGGPGSVYGIGRTLIKRYDYTSNSFTSGTKLNLKVNPKPFTTLREIGKINHNILGVTNQYNEGNISTIANAVSNALLGIINAPVTINNLINSENSFNQINQTSVAYKNNTPTGANGTINSPTLRTYTELRNQITKQSDVTQRISNGLIQARFFTTKNPNINRGATDFKYLRGDRITNAFDRTEQYQDEKLLAIKFTIIDPFKTDKNKTLTFSAYIKGFKETFDGTWNETNYVGRSESFYTYNKFKRNASFNLDIPCFNSKQLIDKHKALETLLSTTAGSYDNNFLGGVLTTIKLGNYLDNQYAIINSISYEVPDESSWDVDKQLAMYIKATFNITIINKVLPQYNPSNTDVFFNTSQK
jgi:hypothetical protein